MVNRTKTILRLLVVIFAVSLLILMGIVFGMIFLENKSKDISFSLNTENKKMSLLKGANSMLDETKEKRDYVAYLFVDKDTIIDFLELVENLGPRTGSKVTVVSVSDEEKAFPITGTKSFIPGNKIRIEITGSWSQVFKTLYLLDYVPATFSLKNISLTKTEDDPKLKQKGFWEASVEATILKSDKTK
jgi:hypothetical protein